MLEGLLWWHWLIIIVGLGFLVGVIIVMTFRTVVPPNKLDIVVRKGKSSIFCSNPEYHLKLKRDTDESVYPEGTKFEETKDIKSGQTVKTVVLPDGTQKRVFGKIIPYTPEELQLVELKNVYLDIPEKIPKFGVYVRRLPLEMLTIKVPNFVAFDMNRARFECDIVAFCAITDGVKASMRIPVSTDSKTGQQNLDALNEQVQQVLWATMRDSTTKMIVHDIINNRKDIIDMIRYPLADALDEWGLGLKDIEIVEFKDAPGGKVITNISAIREQEIETDARVKNALKIKEAKVAEAENDQVAKMREVERDEEVEKRKQKKDQFVAVEQKKAKQSQLEVTRVEKVRNQEIDKEKARVEAEQSKMVAKIEAEQRKDVEKINKEQKELQGQGDKLRDIQQAEGQASYIKWKGEAEANIIEKKLTAEGKGKGVLADNLKKFDPNAYNAYKVIREIEKDEAIYTEFAKSMMYADAKLYMGGGNAGKDAFEFGKAMEGLLSSSTSTGLAVQNRLGVPNDLGFNDKNWIKLAMALQRNPNLKKQVREEIAKQRQTKKESKETETPVKEEQIKEALKTTKEIFDDFGGDF